MRMIDADTFDKRLADAQSECKKNGGNFRYGMLNQVRGNLAEQPTIDAIPVEWIKNRLNAMLKGTASAESCFTIQIMLAEWQKEQEAR